MFLPVSFLLAFLFSGVVAMAQNCPSTITGQVLSASPNPVCSGQMSGINIRVIPGGGGTYSGMFTNGRTFTGLTPAANNITPAYTFTNNTTGNTTEYFELQTLTFSPTGVGSCPATISGNTTITIQPVANISAVLNTPANVCNNGSVSINVSNPNNIGGTYNRSANYNGAGHTAATTATGQAFNTTFTDVLTNANTNGAPITVVYTFTPVSQGSGCVGAPVQVSVMVNPNPTVVCPANVVIGTASNSCAAIINGINPVSFIPATCNGTAPTFSYTLSGATTTASPVSGTASGATFNKGITTVTYTIKDAANNTGNCSFTVTVNDDDAPTFTSTLQPDITVNSNSDGPGNCSAVVSYSPYTATDNCGGTVVITYSQASGTLFPVGTTLVIVTATDSVSNVIKDTFLVKVMDNELPGITCPANITVSNAPNQCTAVVNFTGTNAASATDNCTANPVITYSPASGTAFPVGTTTVTATATDSTGNQKSCTFTVTVNNTINYYVNDGSRTNDYYTAAIGNDGTGNGSKCAPFATINKAISVAQPGDTVYVDAGSYTENLTIAKSLTFRGTDSGRAGTATRLPETVLNAPTTGSSQLITLSGSGIRAAFDGFKIDGRNIGSITNATQKLYIRNTIAELDFSPSSNNLYSAGDSLVLTNNLFTAQDGTNNGSSAHIVSASKLVAKGNTFTSADAIDQLTGSTTQLPVWLAINTNTPKAVVDSNLFTTVDVGVSLSDNASNVTISNNDFVNAKRAAYVAPGNGFGAGIAFSQTLTGTGISININNNNFTNSESGVRGLATGAGPYTLPAGLMVNYNSFTNISDTSIQLSVAFTGTLNAECNWFGTTGTNSIDATTSNQVDYTPYLLSGTDNSTARGFQTTAICGTTDALYVNDGSLTGDTTYTTAIGNDANPGTPAAPFRTIQKAVNSAAPGNTIYVNAGTYAAFVSVNKPLTIIGAKAGADPRPTGTGVRPGATGESIVTTPVVDTTDTGGTLITVAANNISIEGFTFDGNNPALIGGQPVNGVGIQASRAFINQQSPLTSVSNLRVRNNILKNFYRHGIYLTLLPATDPVVPQQDNSVNANVFDNIHRLSGTSSGIYTERETTTDVINNRMTRVGQGAFSTTISGNSTIPFRFSNNNITSYFTGIWVDSLYGASPVCTIANNTLATEAGAGNNDGIRITSILATARLLVSNNAITAGRNGYYLWNCPTTNTVTITGGTVSGGRRGIFATNFYPAAGFGNAASSTYNISNVTIQNSSFAGIHAADSSANTNSATVAVTISGGTQINNAATGLLIEGGSASASFSGSTPASFAGTNTKYIQLQTNGTDVPAGNIDATAVLFDGQTGATATATQNFATEDKVDHRIDLLPLGFVTVKAANAFVTDIAPLAPTATNNDYTRLRNAVATIGTNWTINNNGLFDWREPNAMATWALGSDGIAGAPATPNNVPDDYSILIPDGRTGFTFTAPLGLGTATIQGPGDLASVDFEKALFFSGSNYQNCTISGMTFLDFDLTVGMFTVTDGNNYENLKIINNRFRIPADLNAVVAPADGNPNIGIRYSLGTNQEISNNRFEIVGDGVSSSSNNPPSYARTDALQGNFRDGGTQYDGLKIKNNTFIVTGVPNADPTVIRTIFEGTYNTGAAMELSGNVFTNADPANTATVNRQTAFWISSQSQGAKKVVYKNNEIKGFREGIAWVGGAFSSGNAPVYTANEAPVEIMNNKFDSTLFGVVVRKSPSSTNAGSPGIINYNSFTNTRTGGYAISNESTAADTTTANCNWYGTANANTIAALINGKVAYTPYLTNGTDTSAAMGFQPASNCTACTTLSATITKTNNLCNGGSTGTITANASGGVGPYTYTLSGTGANNTGNSNGMYTGLPAGTYTVTAFGANGCSTSFAPVSIEQPSGTAPDANVNIAAASSYFFPTPMTQNTYVYQIFESAGNPITSATLRITKQNGYTYSFNTAAASTTIGSTIYPVDNTRWTADNTNANLYFIRLNSGNQINCQNVINLEVKLTRNTSNKSNFNVTSLLFNVPGEMDFDANSTTYLAVGN